MTASSVLERCRMALTEIGYRPDLVESGTGIPGDIVRMDAKALPAEVRWMLINTCRQPLCMPCHRHKLDQMTTDLERNRVVTARIHDACVAWRPFQRESCGATR